MTFNEIWDEYIQNKKTRVKPSTVSAYMTTWYMIKGHFGEREITSLTTKKVEKWAIDLMDTHSRKTFKDRIVLLNNIMDYYSYEHEVAVNKIQLKYIHWPTVNAQIDEVDKLKIYSPQEISEILARIAEDPKPCNLLVAVMIATGIRIGEACALTYGNIDFENGTIEITQTLERISLRSDNYAVADYDRMNTRLLHQAKRSALILSTPKCKSSRRAIPLPKELLKVLKPLSQVYPKDYYIGSHAFKPIEPRNFRGHYYKLLEQCRFETRHTPHALRHTYATNLITTGVDVKTTASLLGHGDTSTTLEIYSHATPESKKRAMTATIGKQFKKALPLGMNTNKR